MRSISRTKSTLANLISQYMSLGLAVVNIVLIPFYLKYIDVKLYGAWLASGNIINWLTILDPGLNDLLRQQVAKFYGQQDNDMLGKSIGTGWLVIFV